MKFFFLIIIATVFNITVCLSQGGKTEDGYIGLITKLSPDKQYLKITFCYKGSPADIANIRVGDRICQIDDKKVSELTNPINYIQGAAGTWVKLTINSFGKAPYVITVPRISIPFSDYNFVSEGALLALILTDGLTDYSRMDQLTMALLNDDSKDMFKYRTYDFELINTDDPLMEKEIFKALAKILDKKGMKRSTEAPDLLIIMTYFTGKKEQYTPPQQIISTKINYGYNWYWGLIPVPITESTTREGYTDVTYLTTISLKFLDAHEIGNSKIPPVVWSGSASQISKAPRTLIEYSSIYFANMMYQFPEVWFQNTDLIFGKYYSYTGLWFNKNDLQTISEVIPGSPAHKAGIQKGDKILSINGYKLPLKYGNSTTGKFGEMAYRGNTTGFRYLFMPTGLVFKPYNSDVTTLIFKIDRNGQRMTFEIKPEVKYTYILLKK